MDRILKKQRSTHYTASMIGGFLGGYAIINFCELFANAQTANMIHLVEKLLGRNYSGLLYVFAALLTYMAGHACSAVLRRFVVSNLRALSIALDFAAVIAVGITVKFTDSSFALLPILFVTPIQWNAFNDDAGYVSSTIFSTNNLRQATMSLTQFITTGEKAQLEKAKFYWSTLLYYHIGVAAVCISSMYYGAHSIWFGFIPVILTGTVYGIQCDLITHLRIKLRRYRRNHKKGTYKSA